MRAARVGVVEDPRLAGRGVVGADGGDRLRHGAEVHRDVLGLRHHAARLVEERGRAVAALLDVRGERRADEHGAHLLGDRAQAAAEDLELDRDHSVIDGERACRASSVSPAQPAGHPDGRALELEHLGAAGGELRSRHVEPRGGADLRRAHRDELERALRVRVAVPLGVRGVEALGETGAELDRQLERLARVAEIGLAFGRQLSGVRERDDVRAHGVAPLVRGDEAEGREHAGRRRDEHGLHLELLRERARVQRPRAAERDEREVARIEALLDRDDAERTRHLRVDDRDRRRGVDVAESRARGVVVELDPSREDARQSSEKQVRVGHRRELAAVAVAGRAGIGARALGADPQRAALVEPDDRAAARADGVHARPSAGEPAARRPRVRGRGGPRRRRSRTRPSKCRPCRRRARSGSRRAPRSGPLRRPRPPGRRASANAACSAASASVARPPEERMTSGSRRAPPARSRPRARAGSGRAWGRGTRRRRSWTRARTRGARARPRARRRRGRPDGGGGARPRPPARARRRGTRTGGRPRSRPLRPPAATRARAARARRRGRSGRARRRSARAGRAAPDAPRTAGRGARASGGGGGGGARSPAVVTNAVRAPRRSSSAFVAIVVPCVKRSTSSAPTASAAASTDSSWLRRVGTFAVRTRPSATSTASVNVPPTSIPSARTRAFSFAGATGAAVEFTRTWSASSASASATAPRPSSCASGSARSAPRPAAARRSTSTPCSRPATASSCTRTSRTASRARARS